jgi:hypothetical protein
MISKQQLINEINKKKSIPKIAKHFNKTYSQIKTLLKTSHSKIINKYDVKKLINEVNNKKTLNELIKILNLPKIQQFPLST